MENKRTAELRKRKASIKSRLMAAVAMLMVSTIMLSSTTYAWFILSTAPEVKGMSTTVGSNGSLEIALMDNLGESETYAQALASITSGVGDSSAAANTTVAQANVTWGNIVDVSDNTTYGLGEVTLYPSAMNLDKDENDTAYVAKLADLGQILKTPSYGVDGRIATLDANTYAGKLDNGNFVYDANYYGVRGIGTYQQADPVAAALLAAQSGYASAVRNASYAASNTALSDANAAGLTFILVAKGIQESGQSGTLSLSVTDISSIKNTLTGLEIVVGYIENAIKYAIVAEDIKNNKDAATLTFDTVTLDADTYTTFAAVINEVNTLKSCISTQKTACDNITGTGTGGAYQWSDYSAVLNELMDTTNLTINDSTLTDLSALDQTEAENWALGVQNDAMIEINGTTSILTKTADMINTFESSKYDVQLTESRSMSDAVMKVNKSVATASMVSTGTTVAGWSASSTTGGNARPTVQFEDTYGYMLDLAFRASVDTTLQLSDAQSRVEGDTTGALQGGGSVFTVSADADDAAVAEMADALRVVFLNTETGAIIGVAGMSDTGTENADGGTDYELLMYEYAIDAKGGIELVRQKGTYTEATEGSPSTMTAADYSIMSLTANTAAGMSVLVYLDGNYTDSSMDAVTGTLNLQFSSSEDLTPMEYSNWVDAVPGGNGGSENTTTFTATLNTANLPENFAGNVTVTLLADGQAVDGKTATLNATNSSHEFTDLPTTVNDAAVTYSISVTTEAGYTATADASGNIAVTASN